MNKDIYDDNDEIENREKFERERLEHEEKMKDPDYEKAFKSREKIVRTPTKIK